MSDELLLEVKTVQSGAFRVLVEALKEILTDTNLVFDETGIKMMATDSSETVLIHMKLESEKFEYYLCPSKVVIGLNMNNLYKLIKTMGNNDILTMSIYKMEPNRISLKINNIDKQTQTTFKLNLLDLPDEDMDIPPAKFETELTLPSSDFQKIIRDMTNIGENIEIKSSGPQLILGCQGDFAEQETVLTETQNGLSFSVKSKPEEPIQGFFSLKYLSLFTKCTNLCNLIHLYIKNDYPLVIRYDVANLGHIKLCLSPNVINDEA